MPTTEDLSQLAAEINAKTAERDMLNAQIIVLQQQYIDCLIEMGGPPPPPPGN